MRSILLFFFLIIDRPRRSTLFPYTTLFRSDVEEDLRVRRRRLLRRADEDVAAGKVHRVAGVALEIEELSRRRRPRRDRKSTRLNSSHQIISYAVFGLKKKKFDNVNQCASKR